MRSYLDELSKSLESSTAGMTETDLLRAPEGKWCAAQILEHLRLTYTGTSKMLERNRELPAVEPAPLDDRATAGRHLIFEEGGFFSGLQALSFATPKTPPDPTVRTRVLEDLRHLSDLINEAEQRRGPDAVLGNHFALGPLTAEEWRKFHYAHGSHHLKQIEKLRAAGAHG